MKKIFQNSYLILSILIIYLFIFNFLSYNYFIKDFKELEYNENIKSLYSFAKKIDKELQKIEQTTNDYAKWDETYNFIETKYNNYIYENFRENSSTLEDLGLEFMVFINQKNKIIYSKFLEENSIYNKENFIYYILNNFSKTHTADIMKYQNGHFYLAKLPIVKSDSSGESKGYIISGRKLKLEELNFALFDNISFSDVENKHYNINFISSYLDNIKIALLHNEENLINYIDFFNKNNTFKLSIKTVDKREIYQKGKKNILFFNLIISILFVILIYILFSYMQYQQKLNKKLQIEVEKEIKKQREQEQLLIQQSKLAAMGEMIGNIAHQWRQPLNALGLVMQNIQFAYQIGELDNNFMNKAVEKTNTLTTNMSKTIDDFRNFFKPNKTKSYFKINETIEKTIFLLESTFEHYNIKIQRDLAEDIELFGFSSEFSQSILNILSNAKDALIETTLENKKIVVKSYKKNETAIIEIEDNAGGIEDKIKNKIFEPYFTTKEEGKGTGIGLYMTKTIIENSMYGKLEVENTKDGAKFIIKLPITKE
ncbi:CHASE4 sensor-containing signal transduction histidine kinase [Malaciobacter mytili LMG 24559]|nr:CHASE4 domain-containing protein [Malaciobacter mytili]AXH13758.1 CHASE4 sensor-containing signal transduction histidine kinase [Malaciobacter mytili LMG 24559]